MPLNRVSAVAYHIQNSADKDAGEITFSLDNFAAHTEAGLLNEEVVADFDQYGSTAELQGDWGASFAGGTPTLVPGGGFTGGNAMAVEMDIAQRWTSYGVSKDFDSPQDFSEAIYFQVALHGDSALDGLNPNANLFLEDSEGRRVFAWLWDWPMVDGWHVMYLPFPADGIEGWTCDQHTTACMEFGGNTTWRYDFWDGSDWDDNADLSDIVRIHLSVQTNTEHGDPVATTLQWSDILVGFQTDDPPVDVPDDVPSEQTYIVEPLLAAGQVTIDGLVEAGEWDNASDPATGFVLHNDPETPASEDPEIRALWDDSYLYLLYEVQNENFELAFTPTGDGRDPEGVSFAGDDFEFFIAPGGPMADEYYHIVLFPYEGDGVTYIWTEYMAGGPDSWQPTGDAAEFTYDEDTSWLTIEYRIPWTEFDIDPVVTGPPAEGDVWGMQIGFINSDPSEAVNWEPSDTAGFANGRPFGSFVFTGDAPEPPPPSAAETWHLYQ